ncbi:MAG: type II secretion system minor pseudopilin GspJ [Pseudomonadales bacterium]|nr:type II secretion system minor pseudopilin GspJ [Pseudomonadales bacterium]
MAIFAMLGVMTSQLVSRIIILDKKTVKHGERLMEIQQAMQIFERDFGQLTQRSIRDESGELQASTKIGEQFLIEFSRQGWRNPLLRARSTLQRVAYIVEEETLYRYYWQVLDRADETEPVIQTLLTNVSSAEFLAIDSTGAEYSFWPVAGNSEQSDANTLSALRLNIEVAPLGELNRIWAVTPEAPELESLGT